MNTKGLLILGYRRASAVPSPSKLANTDATRASQAISGETFFKTPGPRIRMHGGQADLDVGSWGHSGLRPRRLGEEPRGVREVAELLLPPRRAGWVCVRSAAAAAAGGGGGARGIRSARLLAAAFGHSYASGPASPRCAVGPGGRRTRSHRLHHVRELSGPEALTPRSGRAGRARLPRRFLRPSSRSQASRGAEWLPRASRGQERKSPSGRRLSCFYFLSFNSLLRISVIKEKSLLIAEQEAAPVWRVGGPAAGTRPEGGVRQRRRPRGPGARDPRHRQKPFLLHF